MVAPSARGLSSQTGAATQRPRLPQIAVEAPDVADELLRRLVRREVAAARVHVPADDILVVALREPADSAEVAAESGQADRDRRRLGRLVDRVGVLVVQPPGR